VGLLLSWTSQFLCLSRVLILTVPYFTPSSMHFPNFLQYSHPLLFGAFGFNIQQSVLFAFQIDSQHFHFSNVFPISLALFPWHPPRFSCVVGATFAISLLARIRSASLAAPIPPPTALPPDFPPHRRIFLWSHFKHFGGRKQTQLQLLWGKLEALPLAHSINSKH